jgi:predicted ferric reductase
MMNPIGQIVIVATTLFPAFQLFSLPDVADPIALFSQYLGLAALILMAWGQIMATRLPGIESLFGGLDRVYVLHKWVGLLAMGAILVHDTVDAEMRNLGPTGPLEELAETLGEISLYGLLILVVISVATFIPYHLWKWTHKAMGGLFAAGAFHFFFIMKPFAMGDPAGLYVGVFCGLGLLAYAWTLLHDRMRPSHRYTIAKVEKTGGAVAITMTPRGRGLRPKPGQFGVVRFSDAAIAEPHPFSFSSIEPDGTLRVTVKALGDFTHRLGRTVVVDQEARIQGPFGRFERRGAKPEVWIAAGIGITPFLTWADALAEDAGTVDLFYCVRDRAQAPHIEEIETLAERKRNLNVHLIVSSHGQRLTPEHVAEVIGPQLSEVKVAFCGPASLRETLRSGLQRFGVSSRRFHYEEFEFRTGVGFEALARWLLQRAVDKSHSLRKQR